MVFIFSSITIKLAVLAIDTLSRFVGANLAKWLEIVTHSHDPLSEKGRKKKKRFINKRANILVESI